MMLDEHVTHAQSHSSGTQVETFFAGKVSIASVGGNSHVIFDGNSLHTWFWPPVSF